MAPNLPQREEYLKKKRRKKIIRIVIVIFSIILLLSITSYVSHRKEIRISKITLSGGVLVTEDNIEKESLDFISGKYFWIIPKNNIFIYPKDKLEKYLGEKFRRIDSVNINKKDLQTLEIKIVERKPVAVWCNELKGTYIPDEGEGVANAGKEESCFFIDQNSVVFASAPYFSGDAYFKYYGIILEENPIGKNYMASSTEFQNITKFVEKIKNLNLKPIYLLAKENDEFKIIINGGGEIYFDTKDSLSKTAENLEALLRTPELSKSNPNNLPVEYIDLRFGNKLFYKLKNQ